MLLLVMGSMEKSMMVKIEVEEKSTPTRSEFLTLNTQVSKMSSSVSFSSGGFPLDFS